MKINPFNDADLGSLKIEIIDLLSRLLNPIIFFIKRKWHTFIRNGKENITIMIVPHSGRRIINLHVSFFTISIGIIVFLCGLAITSVTIIDHSYTAKNIETLLRNDLDSKIQIKKYKEEINALYNNFRDLKPELALLFSIIYNDDKNTLWAKGGVNSEYPDFPEMTDSSPSIEELDMLEIGQDLKIANKALSGIKHYIKNREIITDTPSIVPVSGCIYYRKNNYISSDSNKGINIKSYPGAKIKAPAPGIIESILWDKTYGLTITIQHKHGFSSVFSHCKTAVVSNNQNVSRGETIAYVGKTGNAENYMCYFRMKIGDEFIDPLPFIK